MDKVVKTDAEWRAELDDLAYKVARQHGTGHFAHDVADLERDLDRDLVVQRHARHHVELEADVEVAHRSRHADVGGRGGREHRQLFADVHLGLFLVLHADARIGQQVGRAVLLAQVQDQTRVENVAGEVADVAEQAGESLG